MKKLLLVLVVFVMFLGLVEVQAEPLNKSKFSWTLPTTTMDGQLINTDTAILGSIVYCGATTGVYTVKKDVGNVNTYLIKDVLSSNGTWYCVVTVYNKYGESGYSNEISFPLDARVPNGGTLSVQ